MPVSTDNSLDIHMTGSGPTFLKEGTAERNREVARRAAEKDPTLAGTLNVNEDALVVTQLLFEWLPREGHWQIEWSADRPPIEWRAARRGHAPVSRTKAPEGAVLDVRTPHARRASLRALLLRSGKPTDGWLSRNVHRKVSRILSYGLLLLGLRANDATLLTVGVGVIAAWFVAQTSHVTMIVGALLFWFASVADGVDGEMARLTLTESARGDALDTLADTITYVLCLIAVVIGWSRQGIGSSGATLVLTVVVVLSFTYLWGMHLVRRAAGLSEFFVETKSIEIAVKTAAQANGAPVLRIAATIFVLFRREAFSLTFVMLALATGWRGAVFAGISVALVVVLGTLFGYGEDIDFALRRRLSVMADDCDGAAALTT